MKCRKVAQREREKKNEEKKAMMRMRKVLKGREGRERGAFTLGMGW
jgi:hypothetical protein